MNFGTPPNTTSPLSFSFGTPTATAAPTTTTPSFNFGFQTAAKTSAPVLSFGTPPTALTATTGLNSNPATTAVVKPTGVGTSAPPAFALGAAPATSGFTTATPAFGLGTTTASTGFGLPATTTSAGFGLGIAPQSTGFSLGTSTASTGFSLGTTTTTASTGFSLGNASTSAATLGTSLSSLVSSAPAPAAQTTTPTASVVPSSTPSLNFIQLEENINKWTNELEDQEKVFLNQVTEVNTWDRLLLSNGEKIVNLNAGVEKVVLEQQQLDNELDFILSQQRELEECLTPLEKEFNNMNVSDPDREKTYKMTENLNTQLKQMSEDLKEVIEHINERNKNQDMNDPIVQIGKILNAHMNSLQWIDQSTQLIKQQLEQVSKLSDAQRRDNDTTQNL